MNKNMRSIVTTYPIEIAPAGDYHSPAPLQLRPEPVANQQFVDAPTGSRPLPSISFVRRHWILVLVLSVLGTGLGLAIAWLQPPVYRADASLEIDEVSANNSLDSEGGGVQAGPAAVLDLPTQIKVLQSRGLVDKVVERLKLSERPDFLKGTGIAAGIREKLGSTPAPLSAAERHARALALANASIKVRPSGQTRIVEMLFDSKDPQLSADFVNGLADEFQTRDFETKANANDTTAKWLSQQLAELKNKLETSELQLQTYARSADLIVTEDKSNVAEEKLREVQQEYSKAQADRASKESQYETAAASPPDSVSAVLDSDLVRDYRTRLSELRRQVADYDVVLTPDNPKVKRLKAQIAEIESALLNERSNILRDIGNQANAAKRREAKLRAAYDQQSKTVSDMAFRSVRYDLLKREVDTNRHLYDSMLQKIKSTRVASALQSSNIHVIDRATVPTSPYSPNKPLDVALGLMVGLFAGIAAAFLIEYSDGTLRGLGVAPTVLRVPELGAIPSASRELPSTCTALVPVSKKSDTGNQADDFALETITWNGTHSPLTASYKAVLTSILFQSRKRQHPRVIAVTSPSAGEGKTTTATNLAIAAAGILGRVLIIDADHYRPVVHSIFNVSNSWGLSELLRENQDLEVAPLEALARTTEIPGLYVLPSGGAHLNTSDLLHSKRMGTLLRRLREEFEMIVIDTPPTLVAPDARVMGRHSDGMILVLRNGKTNLNSALAVTSRFKEDQTPILGTVLNDWDYKRDKSGYFGDYYGAEAYRRAV